MMVCRHQRMTASGEHEAPFPSPVVGSQQTSHNVPVSGDVHLYADPATFYTSAPILLADCEGLGAATQEPSAVQYRQKVIAIADVQRKLQKNKHDGPTRVWQRPRRKIAWANTEKTKSREVIVSELYPRLLYSFSDVIVFVHQNDK